MAIATYKDLCLDATDPGRVGEFYATVLGLRLEPHPARDDVLRLVGATPEHTVWVNRVPEPRTAKNRLHLDVNAASVEEVLAAGARVVDAESHRWTVLADPDGGELCVFVREPPIEERLYELVLQCGDSAEASRSLAGWWADVLGGTRIDDDSGYSWVQDIPRAPFFSLDVVPVPEPKTAKNRVHLDLYVDRVDALEAAGATVLAGPTDDLDLTVMADPAGNEFCACPRR